MLSLIAILYPLSDVVVKLTRMLKVIELKFVELLPIQHTYILYIWYLHMYISDAHAYMNNNTVPTYYISWVHRYMRIQIAIHHAHKKENY